MKIIKTVALLFLPVLGILVILFPKQVIVLSFIIGGKVIAPEASAVLAQYCFGHGDTLQLAPDYIRNSPVVLRSLRNLREGEVRTVTFSQKDDWRLSYALNPFQIRKVKNRCLIHQYIKFASDKQTFTVLNLWVTKVIIRDNLVHVFDCKPFVATCRFNLPTSR